MNTPLFPWLAAFEQRFHQAQGPERMVMAARLWACGQRAAWDADNWPEHPQRDAWIIEAADTAGQAVVAAWATGGETLAEALFAAQDVFALECALRAAGVALVGEVASALRACVEGAEEAALDAVAVEHIHGWPWRAWLAEETRLAVIAEPLTLAEMMVVLDQRPVAQSGAGFSPASRATADQSAAPSVAAPSPAKVSPRCSEPVVQSCGEWTQAIRELEGEELRRHFADAWRYTDNDSPLFQLTWILQDRRRSAEDHIYALHALARFAHPVGWQVIVRHAQRCYQSDPEIRMQACLALCWTGRLATGVLPSIINDLGEDRPVRLAAARSLLMLQDYQPAQDLVATVGTSQRDDRRLHAVAAVARGDGDVLARLSLDGFGAPELPRWGLSALSAQAPPAPEVLATSLLVPPQQDTVTLLALPIWAVQHSDRLVAAAQVASRRCRESGGQPPGLLLRAAACLHEQGLTVWEILDYDHRLRGRCAMAQGLAGSSTLTSLDGQLRSPEGISKIITAIGDRSRSYGERDHALLLLVLHTRIYPVERDHKALKKSLRRAIHDGEQAPDDPQAQAMVRRAIWVIGTLAIAGCEQLIAPSVKDNPWVPWTLSQLHSEVSRHMLVDIAKQATLITPQLIWALAERQIDVGPKVLTPQLAENPGFWRYAIVTGDRNQLERLALARNDAALAYQVFLGDGQREPAAMATILRAWRHLEAIRRPDLAVDLLPDLFAHDPDLAMEKLVMLGEALNTASFPQAPEILERALARSSDRRLRTLFEGLKAVLGQPPVPVPDRLRALLRHEEQQHLRYAGRQLHADDGLVRGSGVVELAKTYEVACRHHLASRLSGPLSELGRKVTGDTSALKRQMRESLQGAGLGDIEPHCYQSRIDEVLQAARGDRMMITRPGVSLSLGYWATALALVHQPDSASPLLREGLRTLWTLQARRNDLAHNLGQVAHEEADRLWSQGTTTMPDVLQGTG